MKVVPGDTLDLEVYAKYTQPTSNNSNVATLIATAAAAAFGVNSSSTGEAGNAYTALNSVFSGVVQRRVTSKVKWPGSPKR